MRRRKYLLRALKIISTAFVFLLVTITLFSLARSEFFKINTITCSVGETTCSGQIWTKLFSLSVGKNILFLSPQTLIEEIQTSFPDVDGVKIEKILPNKLEFKLKLREAIAAITLEAESEAYVSTPSAEERPIPLGKEFFIVDEEGVVFKKVDSSLNLPIILISNVLEINIGQKLTTDPLTRSIRIISLLSKLDLKPEIAKVSEGVILIWLRDGPELAFSPKKEIISQVGSLQLILSRAKIEGKMPEKIDLRFDKPVVKF